MTDLGFKSRHAGHGPYSITALYFPCIDNDDEPGGEEEAGENKPTLY